MNPRAQMPTGFTLTCRCIFKKEHATPHTHTHTGIPLIYLCLHRLANFERLLFSFPAPLKTGIISCIVERFSLGGLVSKDPLICCRVGGGGGACDVAFPVA